MWSSEYLRALANSKSRSLASASVLVDRPKRKSVAESRVKRWRSGCRSTVVPSPGRSLKRWSTCISMRARSATWSFVKLGRSSALECAHSSPSLVKIPLPSSGPIRGRRPEIAKSLNFKDRIVLILSGSAVNTDRRVRKTRTCHVGPNLVTLPDMSSSIRRDLKALMLSRIKSRPRILSCVGKLWHGLQPYRATAFRQRRCCKNREMLMHIINAKKDTPRNVVDEAHARVARAAIAGVAISKVDRYCKPRLKATCHKV